MKVVKEKKSLRVRSKRAFCQLLAIFGKAATNAKSFWEAIPAFGVSKIVE